MRSLIVLCCFALAAAKPTFNQPAVLKVVRPLSVSSQYHTQDTLGQYTYGYSAGSSAKAESKTLDGVVRGGYSYLDGNGILQTTNYIADDVNGFRVAATNLPNVVYDTPEVAAAKVAHSVAYNKAAYAAAVSPDVGETVVLPAAVVSSYVPSTPAASVFKQLPSTAIAYSSLAASPSVAAAPSVTSYSVPVSPAVGFVKNVPPKAFAYSTVSTSPSVALVSAPAGVSYSVAAENVPVQVSAVPYSAVVPVTSHQYHVQDDLGQYSYGYSGGTSAKVETKTLDGVTRGKYSYVDGNGIVQSASYVADDVNGFRVAATNIPVGPSSPVVQEVLVSPVVVENQVVADTPAVVVAKSALAPVKYGY